MHGGLETLVQTIQRGKYHRPRFMPSKSYNRYGINPLHLLTFGL